MNLKDQIEKAEEAVRNCQLAYEVAPWGMTRQREIELREAKERLRELKERADASVEEIGFIDAVAIILGLKEADKDGVWRAVETIMTVKPTPAEIEIATGMMKADQDAARERARREEGESR